MTSPHHDVKIGDRWVAGASVGAKRSQKSTTLRRTEVPSISVEHIPIRRPEVLNEVIRLDFFIGQQETVRQCTKGRFEKAN